MCADFTGPKPADAIPPAAVELLDDLDERELQGVIDYARKRLDRAHPTVTEQIEARPDEEVVRTSERGEFTEVVKRQPCGGNCEDCPHPYLYHVTEEKHPDGSTKLHWSYLGRVDE